MVPVRVAIRCHLVCHGKRLSSVRQFTDSFHRATPGLDFVNYADTGYVAQAAAIEFAEQAGFVLQAQSEINSNPRDTKNHPDGVWSLPPTYASGDTDRAIYAAIGESDRMTLIFRKP